MIVAVVLAAGQSRRMGQPKMLLPWGQTTVLGQVLQTLRESGVEEIVVVTGAEGEKVAEVATGFGGKTVFNPDFSRGEMLSSLQAGLRALVGEAAAEAALVCLGDQPQVQTRSVRMVIERFQATGQGLVVPSYQMRRGHPWLVARRYWEEILAMQPPESPRDFLRRHASEIEYAVVSAPDVLADLDTPEDYLKSRP
jgi:molybdenum cofactor cytidylyltransferase